MKNWNLCTKTCAFCNLEVLLLLLLLQNGKSTKSNFWPPDWHTSWPCLGSWPFIFWPPCKKSDFRCTDIAVCWCWSTEQSISIKSCKNGNLSWISCQSELNTRCIFCHRFRGSTDGSFTNERKLNSFSRKFNSMTFIQSQNPTIGSFLAIENTQNSCSGLLARHSWLHNLFNERFLLTNGSVTITLSWMDVRRCNPMPGLSHMWWAPTGCAQNEVLGSHLAIASHIVKVQNEDSYFVLTRLSLQVLDWISKCPNVNNFLVEHLKSQCVHEFQCKTGTKCNWCAGTGGNPLLLHWYSGKGTMLHMVTSLWLEVQFLVHGWHSVEPCWLCTGVKAKC